MFYSLARPELFELLEVAETLLAATGYAVALCPTYGRTATAEEEPMSDACGCGDDEPPSRRGDEVGEEEEREPERLWEVSELRFAAVAGVFLLARAGRRLGGPGPDHRGRAARGGGAAARGVDVRPVHAAPAGEGQDRRRHA